MQMKQCVVLDVETAWVWKALLITDVMKSFVQAPLPLLRVKRSFKFLCGGAHVQKFSHSRNFYISSEILSSPCSP